MKTKTKKAETKKTAKTTQTKIITKVKKDIDTLANRKKVIVIERINDTMKYKDFEVLQNSNRPLDKNHVNILVESFKNFDSVSSTIIVIETTAFGVLKRYIADGQHRVACSKLLNCTLDIKVVKLFEDTPINVKRYVASLNNNLKRWTNEIYLNIFAGNDLKEYNIFKTIIEQSGLTVTDLLFIFTGSGVTKKFQNGDLKFINEKDSLLLLNAILEVKPYVPIQSFVRRGLYFIMKQTNGEYNRMAQAIIKVAKEKEQSGIKFSSDEKSFKAEMIDIYQKEFLR